MRAFVAFGRTKRSLSSALVETIGKNSELMSACSMILRSRADELLGRAQQAGEARPEVRTVDMFRLTHGLIMATEGRAILIRTSRTGCFRWSSTVCWRALRAERRASWHFQADRVRGDGVRRPAGWHEPLIRG